MGQECRVFKKQHNQKMSNTNENAEWMTEDKLRVEIRKLLHP